MGFCANPIRFYRLIKTQKDNKFGLFVNQKLTKDTDNQNIGDENVRLTRSPLIGFYIINQ